MEQKNFSPATEKQVGYLLRLVAERAPDVDPEYTKYVIALGAGRVSQAISRLEGMPIVNSQVRTNRYAQDCDHCDMMVEAGEGNLFRSDSGEWVVTHFKCPEPFPFPHGRYAVENEEGVLRFYVVSKRDIYVQASDELHKLSRKQADEVADRIEKDPQEAMTRYGQEIGNCGVCGRTLTSEWRNMGVGPVCYEKLGWGQ